MVEYFALLKITHEPLINLALRLRQATCSLPGVKEEIYHDLEVLQSISTGYLHIINREVVHNKYTVDYSHLGHLYFAAVY